MNSNSSNFEIYETKFKSAISVQIISIQIGQLCFKILFEVDVTDPIILNEKNYIEEYSINFINDSELKFVIRYNIAWFVIELLNLK